MYDRDLNAWAFQEKDSSAGAQHGEKYALQTGHFDEALGFQIHRMHQTCLFKVRFHVPATTADALMSRRLVLVQQQELHAYTALT